MATLVNYHGLQVVSPDPTGDGGLAIQNDFKNLVQWNPKSSWNNSTNPGATNDSAQDFYPGSLWSTSTQLFLCTNSNTGAAVWVPILIPSSAANGTLLIGNGTGFALSTLTGSVNQVTVTNGPGTITLGPAAGDRDDQRAAVRRFGDRDRSRSHDWNLRCQKDLRSTQY